MCHLLINNSVLTLDGTFLVEVLTFYCLQCQPKTRLIAHCLMRSRYPSPIRLLASPYFDKAIEEFHYRSHFVSSCVHSISLM